MKEQILKLHHEGFKNFEISNILNCSKSTITYHLNEDYRNRHIKNHKTRRHNIKEKAILYKGGKCEICGYDKCKEALDFHHKDPSQKDPNIKGALTRKSINLEKLKPELDKCILVCCRCHREIHANLLTV